MNRVTLLLSVAVFAVGCGGAKKQSAKSSGGAAPTSMGKARMADDRIATNDGSDTSVTADEVLRLYVEATGGKAAYEKLNARISKGTFALPANGVTGPMVAYQQSPNLAYTRVDITGVGTIENGTNGTVVWEKSAMTGARVLKGKERATSLLKSTFNSELKWKELYKTVEVSGSEDIDGSPAYKLVFTSTNGDKETRYYDKDSKLLVKSEATVKHQMGTIKTMSRYSDYKEVDGVRIAHKMVTMAMNMKQVFTVTEIKHNVAIPASRFAIPGDIQKLLSK